MDPFFQKQEKSFRQDFYQSLERKNEKKKRKKRKKKKTFCFTNIFYPFLPSVSFKKFLKFLQKPTEI